MESAQSLVTPSQEKKPSALRRLQARLTPAGEAWKWVWTAVAALASGPVWALLCRQVEEQSVGAAFAALAGPELWLTGLFLGLPVLALALLLHSLLAGNLAVGGAALLLTFINYYKMRITSTPLTLGDFALAGQVGNIAALNRDSLSLSAVSILTLAAAALWLAAAWLFSRPLRLPWGRSALGGLPAVIAFLLLFWGGADAVIYRPLNIGMEQRRHQAVVNAVCGTPLGLWRSVLCLGQASPEPDAPLSLEELKLLLKETEEDPAPAERQRPNIILILSESFFDITGLEGVSYAQDPIPEFHALQKEGVSGTFYSRSLGYGTSNIELEVFTGLNTNLLGAEDLYSCPAETFSRVPAVPELLRENGYYTSLVHMFNDSIYHRKDLFQFLGFDDMYFSGDLASIYPPAAAASSYWEYMNTRISGGAYSDDLMADALIAQYEKMSAEHDGPLFLYGSSIEGHQPYPADKYSPEELTVEPVSGLTGEAADLLRSYCQTAANASAALGKLVDYFRTCGEPTVVVFYGDHRPGLGLEAGGTVYSALGLAPEDFWTGSYEDFRMLYSTDYLIWANDPALLPGEPGSTWDTSCNYLGAALLRLADVELPLYWQLIDRLSQTRVADMFFFFLDRAGDLSDSIASTDPDALFLNTLRAIVSDVLDGGCASEYTPPPE